MKNLKIIPLLFLFFLSCTNKTDKAAFELAEKKKLQDSIENSIIEQITAFESLGLSGISNMAKLINDQFDSLPQTNKESIFILFRKTYLEIIDNSNTESLKDEYFNKLDSKTQSEYLNIKKTIDNELAKHGVFLDDSYQYINAEKKGYLYGLFKGKVSKELDEFLAMIKEYPYLYKQNEYLYIDYYKLYVNVIKLENFINNNPNFFLLNEIKNRYSDELHKLIYGTNSDPIYEYETNILKPEIKKMYEKVISKNESRNSTKEIRNIYNKLKANNFIKITEEEEVAKTNTNTNTSQNSNVHSSDNNWVIGVWEVQTDAGLMNLTILDSQNATFLGDRGKYTIDNGVLNWRDKYGIVSPFKLNYSNQTIDGGGGYVLRKRNVSSNNSQTSRSSSNQSTKSYNRTYRDYFESESAIHEFLSNHTFVSSDGSKLTYSIGELIIKFPSSRLQLINPNILSYNQDRAIIRLMSTQANVSIKFTIDASNGTITDGQTVYRAIN